MISEDTFINKKILIYGLGISGTSCLKYLSNKNTVLVYDDNLNLKNNINESFEYDILDNNGIEKKEFNDEFFTLIGDILVNIIDEQVGRDNGTIEQYNRENDPIQPNNE